MSSHTRPGLVCVVRADTTIDTYSTAVFTYDENGFLDVHTFERRADTTPSGLTTYAPGSWIKVSYGLTVGA